MKSKKLLLAAVLTFNFALTTLNSLAQFTQLHDFLYAEASYPEGVLISDGTFLYGLANAGGATNMGTIFKIMPDGTGFVDMHDFSMGTEYYPFGSLYYDGTFLYGMASKGGSFNCSNGCGVIFKIKPDGTGYTRVFQFGATVNQDGNAPTGSLISAGAFLYGMTPAGTQWGDGTIFKIKPDGTGYAHVYNFGTGNILHDGSAPQGSLYYDGTFLYGMTYSGGTGTCSDCKGTIFKIKPDGTGYIKLFDCDSAHGSNPHGELISDGTFLYGMTEMGGAHNSGVVFKIMPDGTGYTKVLDFAAYSKPKGSLYYDGTFLYGMTYGGGAHLYGTIFKVKPDGTGYSDLLDFNQSNGRYPYGSLFYFGGCLYGMTYYGGFESVGVVFKYCISTTGVAENDSETDIKIYPNPFTSQTTITFAQEQKNAVIKIMDVLGKEVKSINFNGKQLLIEKGEMKSGIYFLQIIDENKNVVNKKIVVQ